MIVLTRPLSAARRFARMLRAEGVTLPILFAPVMGIATTAQGPLPPETLVFTSENGVRTAALMGALGQRDVIAVGPRTAAVAHSFGANVRELGGDVRALADAIVAQGGGPFAHLHGAHVTGDLAGALRDGGLQARAMPIYRQTPRPLTAAARTALTSEFRTILPLFSAKSAEWVAEDLCVPPHTTVVVALSEQVRESWPWSGVALVASKTDIIGMCDAVMQAIEGRQGEED